MIRGDGVVEIFAVAGFFAVNPGYEARLSDENWRLFAAYPLLK